MNISVTTSLAGVLVAMSTTFFAQQRPVMDLSIDEARRVLSKDPVPRTLGGISLAGFEASRELEIGAGIRVIMISGNNGGDLLAFSPAGDLLSSLHTGEAESIQLFDLNGDGVSELITDEITGRGTGIFVKEFNIYSFSHNKVVRIWHDVSYSLERLPDSRHAKAIGVLRIERAFLRFDEARGSNPTRMIYLQTSSDGRKFKEKTFVMEGQSIKQVNLSLN